MAATTTLKLSERLKARIARLARSTQRSPHSVMIEALEREVTRSERMLQFIREAKTAAAAIRQGGAVYRAEDVHERFDRLAKDPKASRPKPWRR